MQRVTVTRGRLESPAFAFVCIGVILVGLALTGCGGASPTSAPTTPMSITLTGAAGAAPMGTVTPAGMFEGYEEVVNCVTLAGWAYDSSQPDRVLTIDILDGNTVLTTVNADQFRQDLLTAHKGDGKHSFAIPIPATLKDNKPHTISFRIGTTEIRLANGPKTVTCPP